MKSWQLVLHPKVYLGLDLIPTGPKLAPTNPVNWVKRELVSLTLILTPILRSTSASLYELLQKEWKPRRKNIWRNWDEMVQIWVSKNQNKGKFWWKIYQGMSSISLNLPFFLHFLLKLMKERTTEEVVRDGAYIPLICFSFCNYFVQIQEG